MNKKVVIKIGSSNLVKDGAANGEKIENLWTEKTIQIMENIH